MHRLFQRQAAFTLVACGLMLAGCRTHLKEERLPETGATLEGTVTYNNEPVLVALIIVQGDNGVATASIGEDGHYKVENVPLGTVHIAVNTAAGKAQMTGQKMRGGPLPKMIDVPSQYHDPATSGIAATINKGSNTLPITILK